MEAKLDGMLKLTALAACVCDAAGLQYHEVCMPVERRDLIVAAEMVIRQEAARLQVGTDHEIREILGIPPGRGVEPKIKLRPKTKQAIDRLRRRLGRSLDEI